MHIPIFVDQMLKSWFHKWQKEKVRFQMSRRERTDPKMGFNDKKEELIGGRHAVLEALRTGKPHCIIMAEGQKGTIIDEITALAGQKAVRVELLSKVDFNNAAGNIPGNQGVTAVVSPFAYCSLAEIITLAKATAKEPFLMMLDHLEDPHNLGAVMRTADAAGVHGLIIPSQRAAGVTATVRKVAAGAAERMPVALVGNLNQAAGTLKEKGFWLYGAEANGDHDYYRADYCLPLVLVIGSEGRGISRLLRQNCDLLISIPMPGTAAGSLNVSAAAAVLVYTALSQREGWSS